jgi:DNA-binding beta-propeller fold protein YncE
MRKARAVFLVCAGILCLLSAAASAQAPPYLTQWGGYGSGAGQFINPHGIAVDRAGSVFVADFGNNRIQKFGPSGEFLTQWGAAGSADGSFYGPVAVAVDATGNVYVAENGSNSTVNQHRVQKFDGNGAFLTKWGALGHGLGEFNSPYGIAVDASGDVYVADSGNDRIQKFTSDGVLVTSWGTHGPDEGQFVGPLAIASDGAGNIYVVEYGFRSAITGPRVQKFTEQGDFLTKWGGIYGTGDGQFAEASDVAVDADGNVYVVDSGNNRIQAFTSGGAYLTQWGTLGNGPGQFDWPLGVAVAASGSVYVADWRSHRIQVFGSLPVPAHSTSWGRIKALYR